MNDIPVLDDTNPNSNPTIPVDDITSGNASDKTATDRAFKADKILGKDSPGVEVLKGEISLGNEATLRSDIAQRETAKKQSELLNQLKADAEAGNFPTMDKLSTLSLIPEDPETVIENLYSKSLINSGVAAHNQILDPVRQNMEESPEDMMNRVNTAQGIVYRNEIAKTIAQDISDQWENTPWLSAEGIGGVAGNFIPFANWAILKGHGLSTGQGKGEFLSGDILQKMATELYSINDPYEFKRKLKENVDSLAANSIPVAVQYARAMVSYGTSDQFLDNTFDVLDVATTIPVGALVSKGAKLASGAKNETNKALKDLIKANGSLETNAIDLKAASGDTLGASKDLAKSAVQAFVEKDTNNISLPLRQRTKSLFNPDVMTVNSSSVSQEVADRITTVLRGNSTSLLTNLAESTTVPRIASEEALNNAVADALVLVSKKYNQAIDGVVDVSVLRPDVNIASTGSVRVKIGATRDSSILPEDANGFINNPVTQISTKVSSTNSTGGIVIHDKYTGGYSQHYLGIDGELIAAKEINLVDSISRSQIYQPRSQEERNLLINLLKTRASVTHPDIPTALKIQEDLDEEIKRIVTGQDSSTSLAHVEAKFGTKTAEGFDSAKEAEYWMEEQYRLNSDQYRIKNENGKFYGIVDQYLPETSDAVRDALIDTNSTTPRTFLGQILDAAHAPNPRGGDEIVSATDMATRKLATSASQEMMRVMADVVRPTISPLGKEKVKRLNRLLEIDRAFVGEEGEQGRFLNNIDEYTSQYRAVFNESPTEEEITAYLSLRQISDLDYAVRDLGLFRDMARLDVSNHSIDIGGKASSFFKAKPVDTLPDWSKEFSVLTISEDGKPRKIISSSATDDEKVIVNDLITNGYKIAQVYEPNIRPLSSVSGDRSIINFVVAKTFETEKLGLGNLSYNPSVHREYVSKHFVKQPKISDYDSSGRKLYEGDSVALAFETQAEATKYAERMDTARKLMNAGDDKKLAEYLANNLPFKVNQFKQFFVESTDKAGNIIERRFSPDESFRYVSNKSNTFDQYGMKSDKNLLNLSDSEFNLASENDRRFLAKRDPELWTIKEVKEQGGLIHKLEGARQLDPLASITRTMRSVMEARFMNDYKIGAIERWIAEFGDTMNVSREELRRNPTYYFHNPEFNENFGNKALLAAARQSQINIKNFLGVETAIDKQVNTITQRLADAIYGTLGQRVSDFTVEKLATVSDPSRFLRGMAFHTQMGFLNPVQIAVNGQTAFVISAISPKHGPVACVYSLASQLTSLTRKEGVMKKMNSMLDNLGIDSKVFSESNSEMRKTGWDFIGGESMWSEGTLSPKVVSNAVGKALDAGTVFFKGTERWIRLSGWHTAFMEFREANPTKAITDIDRARILNRANTLTVNMTSASKANWEKGILSVPTQFMSYQARLMDMVWGKQLTNAEKARTLGTMAFLYGVPGAGAAVTGYSAYDSLRTYALDNGIDLSGTTLSGILEGIPHLVAQQMGLGEWNYSSRYGPSGFTAIQDLIEGDKGLVETLMGPSGSIFNQNVKQANPTLWAISDVLRGDSDAMQLLPQDFIDAARGVATLNSAHNVLMAMFAGKYISKNQVYTANTDTMTSLISAITGLQPNEIPDTYLLIKNKESWDDYRKTTDSQYIINFQRGLMAYSEGNIDLGKSYFKRARSWIEMGRYNQKEEAQLFQKAIKNQGPLVDKIRDDYWQNAPAGTGEQRLQRVLDRGN